MGTFMAEELEIKGRTRCQNAGLGVGGKIHSSKMIMKLKRNLVLIILVVFKLWRKVTDKLM